MTRGLSVALKSLEKTARIKKKQKVTSEAYPIHKTKSGGGKKSKRKGSGYERRVAKKFEAYYGCSIRRTPGSGGWATREGFGHRGDLVFADRKAPYHVECKCQEGWDILDLLTGVRGLDSSAKNSLERWWQQTIGDCPRNKKPMLVFTRNHAPDLLMMYVTDLDQLDPDANGWWIFKPHIRLAANNAAPERVIMRLDDFFGCVRPPKRSPNYKTWEQA